MLEGISSCALRHRAARLRAMMALLVVIAAAGLVTVTVAGGAGSVEPYQTYQSTVAADGPAAQYRFDDPFGATTLQDSAGTLDSTATGIGLGGAGPFPGSESGLFDSSSVASLPASPLSSATTFTAEAWIKWDDGGAAYDEHVFDFGSSTGEHVYLSPAVSATGHPMRFEIRSASGTFAAVEVSTLDAGSWEYVAVTEDATGDLTLYVNGRQAAQTAAAAVTPAVLGATSTNWLGRSQSSGDPRFSGRLSNLAFYTEALTAGQIRAHYDAGNFPVDSAAPVVSGTARDGQTLTADSGTWTGLAPITYAYQWRRCDGVGNGCSDIAGATNSSYQLTSGDVGSTVRATVTATNGAGEGGAISDQTAAIAGNAPANTTTPSITGEARDDQTLSADRGAWTGTTPISFAYRWRRCDGAGANCSDIPGATGSSYRVAGGDVGATVRVVVTATNAADSTTAMSAATEAVSAVPPANISEPAISGVAREGRTVSANTGAWSGTTPISYAYHWRRCDSTGTGCADINNATDATYKLRAADVDKTVRVEVTATNAAGTTSATSAASEVVRTPPDLGVVDDATVTGATRVGETLTSSPAVWTLDPDSVSRFWERCDWWGGLHCQAIDGATGDSYTLTDADLGEYVRVVDTATRGDQQATSRSDFSEMVDGRTDALHNVAKPTLSGAAVVGGRLYGSYGQWSTPTDGLDELDVYALECDDAGKNCAYTSSDPQKLSDDPSGDFVFTLDDYTGGKTYRFEIWALHHNPDTGAYEWGVAQSALSPVVTGPEPPPVASLSLPQIDGEAQSGGYIYASPGEWSGRPQTYDSTWLRCDRHGEACEPIGDEQHDLPWDWCCDGHSITNDDIGHTLRFRLTARRGDQAVTVTSAASDLVPGSPPAQTPSSRPAVSESLELGQTATVTDSGTWTGDPTISYRWFRCEQPTRQEGSNWTTPGCSRIPGADGPSYTSTLADAFYQLRVEIVASNEWGSATTTQSGAAFPGYAAGFAGAKAEADWPWVDLNGVKFQTTNSVQGPWPSGPPLVTDGHYPGLTVYAGRKLTVTNDHFSIPARYPSGLAKRTVYRFGVWRGDGSDPIEQISESPTFTPTRDMIGATVYVAAYEYLVSPEGRSMCYSADCDHRVDRYWDWDGVHDTPANFGPWLLSVVADAPTNTTRPTIEGVNKAGSTLTAHPGRWSQDAPQLSDPDGYTYAYSWEACDQFGDACAPIAGADGRTYTVTSLDESERHSFRVGVRASDLGGTSDIEYSDVKFPVGGIVPMTTAEGYGPGNAAEPNVPRCHAGDPVDCATGNQFETQTDLAVGGRGLGLEVTRTYNSQRAVHESSPGPFGYGWTAPYSDRLDIDPAARTATVHQADGSSVPFAINAEGEFIAPGRVHATLAQTPDGAYRYTLADQTSETFDAGGRLASMTDGNGNETTLVYDAAGHLTAVTDPAGRAITFAYTADGQVASVTDPAGHTVSYTYTDGELVAVTHEGSSGPQWRFAYDDDHQLTATADGNGHTTTTDYDDQHRVVAQTDALDRTRTWSYSGDETTITNPAGDVTVERFENGVPVEVTRASGTPQASSQTVTYDDELQPVSMTDGEGHTTTFAYDSAGNRTRVTDPNGHSTRWTYDAHHNVTSVTSPAGRLTTMTYDPRGNLTSVSRTLEDPAGDRTQTTTYSYDAHGQFSTVTDPLQRTSTYTHNDAGDLTSATNPQGEKTTWAYDADSRVTATVSPRGTASGGDPAEFTTTIIRDELGRPTGVVDPLGRQTTTGYDDNGNVTQTTDAEDRTTRFSYDAEDQATSVTRPDGSIERTAYDADGQVISHSDGKNQTTTYRRDHAGQIVAVRDPLQRETTNAYDQAGRLASSTDALNRTTSYRYDASGQLTGVDYTNPDTPDISLTFDADGRRTAMTDGTGESTFAYDSLGRLISATNGHGDTVRYGYDLADQQTAITYPNGRSVTRRYDAASRAESITDWLGNTTRFGYDADANLLTTTFPAPTGDVDQYAYDAAGQLNPIAMTRGADVLASLTYTRNSAGQLTSSTPQGLPGQSENYQHDGAGRLSQVNAAAYAFDAADNPTQLGATSGLTYDAANQLAHATTPAGPTDYTYNPVGDRTATTPATGAATTYRYDQADQLVGVERDGDGPIAYSYDGEGLRAAKTKDGATSRFTWDRSTGIPLLLAKDTTSYVYGADGLPLEQIDADGSVVFLHHDQLGSTRLLTDETGQAVASFSYDAHGNPTGSTGTTTTPFGYVGEYTETDTGLVYLRARYYDPATAQFLTRDPLEASTGQPYAYAGGDPLDSIDPSGLACLGPVCAPSLQQVSDFAAGFGDAVSFGYTRHVRQELGVDGVVNPCSGAYVGGEVAGVVTSIAAGGGAGASRVAVRTTTARSAAGAAAKGEGALSRLGRRLADERGEFDPSAFRRPRPGSGKGRASDVPSWVRSHPEGRPLVGESGKDFAKRLLDNQYGEGNWSRTGPGSEYNQIKKYGDRGFE